MLVKSSGKRLQAFIIQGNSFQLFNPCMV